MVIVSPCCRSVSSGHSVRGSRDNARRDREAGQHGGVSSRDA